MGDHSPVPIFFTLLRLMAQIINIVPTTELEAVNTMLAASGEAPIEQAALDSITSDSVQVAVNTLRNATREVLTMGWRFNTENGVQVAPTATYNWLDRDGTTTQLNIFKKPSGLLKWRMTRTAKNSYLDLIERRSKKYQEASAAVMVLYDRARNRDGAEVSQFPFVYIDTVFAVNFEDMPEAARRYVTVKAARVFIKDTVGSETLARFKEDEEALALRNLELDEGDEEDYSLMQDADVQALFGGRPLSAGGAWRPVYPGAA